MIIIMTFEVRMTAKSRTIWYVITYHLICNYILRHIHSLVAGKGHTAIIIILFADDFMYWRSSTQRKQTPYPWYRHADPSAIQMTSYALMTLTRKRLMPMELTSQFLMTLMEKRPMPDTASVFRWLHKQRGPYGGFFSMRVNISFFFGFLNT